MPPNIIYTCNDDSDEYALGAHLYSHCFKDKSDFSKHFKVSILEVCSPKVLEVKEHKFIHKLNSLKGARWEKSIFQNY